MTATTGAFADTPAWAEFEAALERYLDAEMAVLEAAVKMARDVRGVER